MKRLTLKDDEYWVKSENQNDAYQKLGQLEDIEAQFEIDLITLFKAVTNGFWYKTQDGYCKIGEYDYAIDPGECRLIKPYEEDDAPVFYFEDYGNDWALTKEELENGK